MTDFYNTLGIDRTADPETIKRAYRKLAAQHHPDRGGDTHRFQEIQAAYDTLSDPEKKAQYDNPQPQGFHFQFGNGFPGGFHNIFEQHFGPGHPFSDIFGGRQGPRNRTLNLQVQLSLKECYNGKDLMANLTLPSGREQTVEIKIPPGVHEGTTLRLAGMGEDTIPNAPRGDLHVTIFVEPHPLWRRNGDDLIREVEISCLEAMLGKTIEIETLGESLLEINIKPGTQPGQVLSINGYGMPNLQNPRVKGKLLIEIKVKVPTLIDDSDKKIIESLRQKYA